MDASSEEYWRRSPPYSHRISASASASGSRSPSSALHMMTTKTSSSSSSSSHPTTNTSVNMATAKLTTSPHLRLQSTTLESLAIVNGILESPASSHPLVERLRAILISRGSDGYGFAELQRRLHVMDRDGSRSISLDEFRVVLQSKSFSPLFDDFCDLKC